MKKWFWLLPIAALLVLAGCSVPGNVYISFDWPVTSTLTDWANTDPNIDINGLNALYAGHDYLTLPGYYEMWYNLDAGGTIISGFGYTLTDHHGAGWPGEDAYFYMYLGTLGPDFYQIQGLTSPSTGSGSGSPAPTARSAMQTTGTFDSTGYEFKKLGEYSQTKGRYTLTVQYGVWEPKK